MSKNIYIFNKALIVAIAIFAKLRGKVERLTMLNIH